MLAEQHVDRMLAGIRMGAWFMTYATGHLVAGWIAGTTAASGEPGVESVATALTRYAEVFARVGVAAMALGLALLRRWVQKMIDPATTPRAQD